MNTASLLYTALVKKYEYEISAAEATLNIYFTKSVGIGEHPQQLDEMDKLVESLTTAKDKLSRLDTYYSTYHTSKPL